VLSSSHQVTAGVLLLALVTIAYGGTFVLRVVRGSVPANDLQRRFYRAGHAHAGVLVILGLLVLLLTDANGVAQPYRTLSTGVLWAALLIPAGFFLSVVGRDPQRPNRWLALLWVGAASLAVGLVAGGIGLITAR
jgi:hypothetical protein